MLARNGNETKIAWSFWGAFGFLAILVGLNADVIQNIDNIVFNSLVRIDNPSLTAMFKIVALLASPAVSVLIIVIFSRLSTSKSQLPPFLRIIQEVFNQSKGWSSQQFDMIVTKVR